MRKLVCIVLCLALVIGGLTVCNRRERGEDASRVKCASNLKQIGQALLIYSNQHDGDLPPRLSTLLAESDLVGEVFICSHTDDTPVKSRDLKSVQSAFASGGHNSYCYAPPGKKWSELVSADVLAFERNTHYDGSMNVLFGDGHVEFLSGEPVYSILDQYAQGVRPLRVR